MVDKLPFLPDEHHFAIASVATRSAQLDHHIEHLIYMALARSQRTAEFALKNLGADRLVNFLKAVLIDAAPESEPEIAAIVAAINRVRGERNDIMHWIWGKSDEPERAVHASIRPFREHQQKTKTALEIQQIANDLLECTRALIKWSDLLHARLRQPSPEKLGLLDFQPSSDEPSERGR